ncbi:hypothetical protein P73_2455 [Celeribacter indicus]|uniref:Uncharacterized protein n=2 Tax=Celeribacter indicus TaxID=1208324 RepID=A0A0B5E1A9_9RHOB|nr:hypothetical protein P73_2455 [Celeribacter indicus]
MNAEIVATLEEAYPALSPDMHQVTFEVLQLLGLLTIMTKEDRELSVREKEQELRLRGAQCEMSLHDNTLRLTMAGGDIKYEFGLPEPFPDNLPDD